MLLRGMRTDHGAWLADDPLVAGARDAGRRCRRHQGSRLHEGGVVVAVGVDDGRLTRRHDFVRWDRRRRRLDVDLERRRRS